LVLVNAEGTWRRLINLRFERRGKDLEYQVDLPHFAYTRGVLRRFTIGGPPGTETKKKLQEGGTTTSHLLKYSHHPDGRAQFSQDGKAITQIITHTVPLKKISGHLFTINNWGADAFAPAKGKDLKAKVGRSQPLFIDTAHDPRPGTEFSGRIVGEAYRLRHFSIKSAMRLDGDWSRPVVFR
jgi:hypothetical protein